MDFDDELLEVDVNELLENEGDRKTRIRKAFRADLEEAARHRKDVSRQLESSLDHFGREYEPFRDYVLDYFPDNGRFVISKFDVSVVLESSIGQTAVRSFKGAQVEMGGYILGIRPLLINIPREEFGTILAVSFENSASIAPWGGNPWVPFHPKMRWIVQGGRGCTVYGGDSISHWCEEDLDALLRGVFIDSPAKGSQTSTMKEGRIIHEERTQVTRGRR